MARNLKIFANITNPAKQTPESYQAEIDRIIDYRKASGKQSMRRRIGNFLSDFRSNLILNITNSIFSLFLVLQYIYSTYLNETFENIAWGSSNFVIHLYMILEYWIRLYTAKNRKQHLFSSDGVIDFCSLVPFFVIRLTYPNPLYEYNTDSVVNFANLLCLIRILKFENCLTFIVNFTIFNKFQFL